MLQRDIFQQLIEWKNRKHHPLVIRGLRQIGKTYITKEFGKQFYENVVYLDFRANIALHKAFEGNFDVNQMILSISSVETKANFVPNKTLLIFDEIQDCANARSSLKYWDIDGRFDVICTGSFLGVKGFRTPYTRGISVGYEEQITMYPLSFHEFLINTDMNESVYEYVEKSIEQQTVIEQTVNQSIRSLYLQYLIVGGMPEVVNIFFETHDLNAVRKIQNQILNSIKDDFGRYKDSNGIDKVNETLKLRAEACLNSLPAQLSKEYKKFQYSLVNVKGHSPEKADGLQYLEDVGLVVRSYNVRSLSYPLEAEKISSEFKVFFIDTGLLISQLEEDVPAKILSGDFGAYKGAVAENMVASCFTMNRIPLFYFHAPSGSPELDFLFEKDGKVVIIECKSSNNRATSMKYVLSNPKKYGEHPAIKLADSNIGYTSNFETMPLYSLGFIKRKPSEAIVDEIDIKNLKAPEQI